jgi:Domain of unknown function (DUF5671)
MDTELVEFVRGALAQGLRRPDIARALGQAGWAEGDIAAALDAFADVDFPLPVPKPRPYLSAREVFTYLVLFAALYVSAGNLVSLVFESINKFFPDPVYPRSAAAAADTIRRNAAALIVAFPLFVFTLYSINRAIAEDPSKRRSRPRKWLVYLTSWVTVLILMGDFGVLIYKVLGGELTIRFLLEVVTVAIVAGSIFAHFFWEIRKDENS